MFFQRYYLDCLSLASYMIADEQTRKAVVMTHSEILRSTWKMPKNMISD